MIRCVMFDFGNVLVHFDTQRFYDFVRSRQRSSGLIPGQLFHADFITKYDLGQIDDFEFFESAKKVLGLDVGLDEFFFEFVDNMKPDLKMVGLKQILRQNGIKLAVVSNINRYHFQYVQAKWPEVFSGFDYRMLSFQHGFKKPDHRMWDTPAQYLGVSPEECFFVDDLRENVDAFERLGGVGHHYDVIDEKYCPNGRLETERNRLLLRMVRLGMLNLSQAGSVARVDF